jgi:hypothetical protein
MSFRIDGFSSSASINQLQKSNLLFLSSMDIIWAFGFLNARIPLSFKIFHTELWLIPRSEETRRTDMPGVALKKLEILKTTIMIYLWTNVRFSSVSTVFARPGGVCGVTLPVFLNRCKTLKQVVWWGFFLKGCRRWNSSHESRALLPPMNSSTNSKRSSFVRSISI